MKATSHSFALAAYLPIPKFPDVTSAPLHATLVAQVYHTCMDIIMENLQVTEKDGVWISDPNGFLRMVRTPLV